MENTSDRLRDRITQLSENELIELIKGPSEYTEESAQLAKDELIRRESLSPEEINQLLATRRKRKAELIEEESTAAEGSMFKKTDYMPFMLGVFIIGGLIEMPLTYGIGTGLGYFESLPWSLASCVVFLIAFRWNGTISWGRAVPAIAAIIIGARVYSQNTGKPAFAAGGILGFLLVMVCGYLGIGIGRILKR